MKIDQSTLSMDAFYGHRDVVAVSEGKEGRVNNLPSDQRDVFTLDLAEEEKLGAENIAGEVEGVDSGTVNKDNLPGVDIENKNILELAAGSILGQELYVTGIQRTFSSSLQVESVKGMQRGKSPFDMFLTRTTISEKTEFLDFSSAGSIQTTDGRTIEFSLDLSIERVETQVLSSFAQRPLLLDPLVLSFDDGFDSLSGATFSFDLTGDGIVNNIGVLSEGSGFLALDNNKDGVINDGLELFGPLTGHGYNELAGYDFDDNGWIDESDPVFEELLLWMGAGDEKEELVTLREAGVGAISLANLDSHFDLTDGGGNTLGTIARAGIFFMENGEPRSIQELDLNVNAPSDPFRFEDEMKKETIEQAIASLYRMLERRRNQLRLMARNVMQIDERKESLAEKFWSWRKNSTPNIS